MSPRYTLKTIMWMLGDMHTDFGNKRMFILYGPGGVGKSSVVNILATVIGVLLQSLKPLVCLPILRVTTTEVYQPTP